MATVTRTELPAPTVLRGVRYIDYVRLRDYPGNDGLRMTYHDGTLEILSPLFPHELGGRRLGMIVNAYTAVLGIDCQGTRSTTFRKGLPEGLKLRKGKGKEPDESFYFTQAAVIRDKKTIDLNVDPPPELWIEVDNRASSKGRLPLYAELGVPEVWRYDARRHKLWFGWLENGAYTRITRSRCLPRLTPEIVLNLLDEARSRGEPAWDNWMRGWMDTTLRDTE